MQVSSTKALRISGERPYTNKPRQRFHKEFQIPPNCNTANITAKYKGGILHIRLPPKSNPPVLPEPHQTAKQQPEPKPEAKAETETEKKSSVATEKAKVEAEEMSCNCGGGKVGKLEMATTKGGNVMKKLSGIVMGVRKFILPVLVAVFIFMYVHKRLSLPMFVGVEEPSQTDQS